MEALNGVISLSAKFKNLNNIRRILLFLYIAHTPLNYIFRALSAVMTKSYIVSICMGHEGVDGVKTLSMVRL